MYKVLIIEDDPMVASIDRKYVEMTPGFQVLDTIPDGSRALDSPLLARADLIILDYFMPRMNGDEFIDLMHHAGYTPSVIMVTSANDSGIVTSLLSRGVTDYLVKPFEYDRFRDALLRFDRLKKQRKSSQDIFDQEEIDRLIRGSGPEKPSPVSREQLAKGLNQATLDTIRGFLSDHREDSFTCDQIARKVSLSRITVRRYVNYLLEQREVVSSIDYQTGGRPGMYYRYTGK